MSEVRHDWLSDRWVIFAPSRSERPDEYKAVDQRHRDLTLALEKSNPSLTNCPFCVGNEEETPPPVLTLGDDAVESQCDPYESRGGRGEDRWKVRVVPNKFPAVIPVDPHGTLLSVEENISGQWKKDPSTPSLQNAMAPILFHRRPLLGAHEVIIESPQHLVSATQLSLSHLESVFQAFQMRLSHWRRHPSLQYAVVFKNCGVDAGASLVHTHSQLIATSFVPPEVTRVCHRMEQFRQQYDRCYECTVLAEEREKKDRILLDSEEFVAFCPFASSLPYAFVIAPTQHQPRFEDLKPPHLQMFAGIVHRLLSALESLLPEQSYNFVLHTSPFHDHWNRSYHWRFEAFPRLTKMAGFEWGSDCMINPVLPEVAAEQLRKAASLSTPNKASLAS